jgi:mono/diheme cytochrome c family protein
MKKTIALAIFLAVALPSPGFADGAAVFKARCAMCHGPDGAGQTPIGKSLKVRDLRSAEVQKLTDAEITKVIVEGKGKMPKSAMSADDVKAVVAFLRTLKK